MRNVPEDRWVGFFTHPHGWTARFVGWVLLRLNGPLYHLAVDRLAPRSTESILEIGFGPGLGLYLLGARARWVAGIDPSDEMHRQASRRCADAVRAGRLDLRRGTADALPWPDRSFDGVLSLNNVLLWAPLERSLREVARVLRPGGRFVVGLHQLAARNESPEGEGSVAQVEARLLGELARAGFTNPRPDRVGRGFSQGLLLYAERPLETVRSASGQDTSPQNFSPREH